LSAKNRKRSQASEAVSSKPAWTLAVAAFLSRRGRTIALIAVAIASIRIAATYTVFNQTFDEPLHIGCGVEWLGGVVCADETPPLARVAEAVGPYLLGARAPGTPYVDMDSEYTAGAQILYRGSRYDLTLALARLGNLPFFWIACLVVYLWGVRYYDAGVAAIAVLLFSFLPPVLAHAGVATVDMALTALLGAAFLSALAWIERPDLRHSLLFGTMTALAILAKYSALVFLPAGLGLALVVYIIVERPGARSLARAALDRAPSLGVAIVTSVVLIWAAYRFSYGASTVGSFRLPAPQLFSGLKMVADHNKEGHYAYLLGSRSTTGWWYFYPVVLAVKTPLAFLVLLGVGVQMALRKTGSSNLWIPLVFSGGILIVGLFSQINIGVRHILPVYIGFSLVAAVAVMRMLELAVASKWTSGSWAVLLLWMAGGSLWIHPDYLAYFNELAGSRPENVLLDSDLDWGQDMKRLSQRLREAGAKFVTFTPLSDPGLPQVLGFPPVRASDVPMPTPGWNAVSLTQWKSRRLRLLNTHPEVTPWPDLAPPGERIGRGIMLWYFPPGTISGR
jgi:4-amino-4-deoxy-L-arabinose transferase-like glycosyltransferase